ncbi:receptor-type tyrosine-protein phosphatase H-like [Syngnathoides biaculeatus]|uniref:receptor-type tyrosine-protein phosphatase H-like n=1 Tax=Syngnathoides biaculeatus TaxID=300417 RepID=UPI002ADE92E9|nr:receptor-type tyrosine-protein phosphatase H-like [Syngnathoides biaculeatus]
MENLRFEITAGHLLLCVFLNLLWGNSDSIETSRRHTTASGAKSTALFTSTPTSLITANPPPENVGDVTVVGQDEIGITLKWEKVNDMSTYFLLYDLNGSAKEESVDPSPDQTHVTHVVGPLSAGRKYQFRIITQFMGANSTGYLFSASTAPLNAKNFKSLERNTSSITLQWERGDKVSYAIVFGDTKEDVAAAEELEVTHTIAGLTSGTEYFFTLFTVFETVRSSGNNLTAVTAPDNVEKVTVITQTVSSVTLSWNKVGEGSTYVLHYSNHSIPVEVTGSAFDPKAAVTQEVGSLAPGTKYDFTLITVFQNVTSTGFVFDAVTVPSMVAVVNLSERSETSATLSWETADPNWSYLVHIDGGNVTVAPNGSSDVSRSFALQPGTEYPFAVITLFSGLASAAYKGFFVTAVNCADVAWHVTSRSIRGTVEGSFTSATASNGSSSHLSPEGPNVSFAGLYPGATYNVSLEYRRESAHFLQCQLRLTTIPPGLTAHCEYWEAGYSVFIVWDAPEGLWTSVEVNVSGRTHTVQDVEQRHIKIGGFQPARTYQVSLSSLSGTSRRSEPYVFQCPTDPRGVIAGSVLAVLLLGALVGLAAFVLLKRPDIVRKKKSLVEESPASAEEIKDNSLAEFPGHFSKLSMDNNRGFSNEYESLAVIGIQHTQNAALMPENTEKNRFTNVLPYDWSRVKLHTANGKSDYINASYMPGYNNSREYIATQGPLPATVSDFWRMIWEQRVSAIVMVTNCTEGRRIKCEQYWPAHRDTCLHSGLAITTASEQQDTNWTLREFRVKHKNSSPERTVKHFHFTAWPDHGVPQCTDVLMKFRGLVRRHMDSNRSTAPTVVHCSAGVGRTGTIIALDVLLQQLLDNKVDIKAFVRDMRLRRPHMVQTESQYVFLHQCIMDYLQPQERTEEGMYQNADIIYANATALREFNKGAT